MTVHCDLGAVDRSLASPGPKCSLCPLNGLSVETDLQNSADLRSPVGIEKMLAQRTARREQPFRGAEFLGTAGVPPEREQCGLGPPRRAVPALRPRGPNLECGRDRRYPAQSHPRRRVRGAGVRGQASTGFGSSRLSGLNCTPRNLYVEPQNG